MPIRFAICALYIFTALNLAGQNIRFNHISTDEGLSHYTVTSLYQDEFGTVWIATPLGVNRYNGHSVTIYQNDLKDPNSLSCNSVKQVSGNKDGLVYILTKQSLEIFDLRKETFTKRIEFSGEKRIDNILYKDGLYGVAGGSRVVKWDDACSVCDTVTDLPPSKYFRALFVDRENGIWAASPGKLLYAEAGNRNVRTIMDNIKVSSIYQDNGGRIMVGTMDRGILVWNSDKEGPAEISTKDGLASNFVRSICQDDNGIYWAGTDKGLNRMEADLRISGLYVRSDQFGSISNSSIYDIMKDKRGNIWLGTYFGGVNHFNPSEEPYSVLRPSSFDSYGLSSPIVRCMLEDRRQNLWIATEGGGLNMYDRRTGKFKWFKSGPGSNRISGNNVKSLWYDREKDILWIGTHLNGLNRLDLKTMKFTSWSMPEDPLSLSNVVSGIVPYKDSLIISSYQGVFAFSPKSGKFEKMLDLTYIRTMFMDSRNTIWMGSTTGQLFAYDLERGTLESYRSKIRQEDSGVDLIVYDITEDGDGNIWIATFGGGLKKYDRKTGDFTTFNTLNSEILSDNILALKKLDEKRLIATAQKGYIILDTKSNTFVSKTKDDGVPLNYMMENSLYCSDDGHIYIGSNGAIVSFREKGVGARGDTLDIFFSGLWVNGERIRPGDGSGILENSMPYTSEIRLSYDENSLVLEYTVPKYYEKANLNLVYSLSGDEKKWHKLLPGDNNLQFPNLSPGKYTLTIKGDEESSCHVRPASLDIVIKPPFYKSTLAYLLYFLIIGGIGSGMLYIYISRLRMNEYLRYQQKKIHDEKMLNKAKLETRLQFFFTISHEFCTPLTIIIGELELLLMQHQFVPAVEKKLKNVYKNSLQLYDLIYELLEFKKQNMGQMKLHVEENDICRIADESYQLYREYALSRKIDFSIEPETRSMTAWCDSKLLGKVFNNLLSNAFKYTDSGGKVVISISSAGEEICIKVTDNGCGMDEDDIKDIFHRFYQGKQATDKTGIGIGLSLVKNIIDLHNGRIDVHSELNKGTEFCIFLKRGKDHFNPEDLSAEPIRTDDDIKILPEAEIRDVMSEESPDKKPSILIVEDNDPLREMLETIFARSYNVITAKDGREGLEKVNENSVDIVVSDIVMPNLSGTELCRMIKEKIETCHIPVILLSVRADVENRIEGFETQADDYITKPFSVNLLLSRCNNLLRNREMLHKKFLNSPLADVEVLTNNEMDKEFTAKLIQVIEENLDNPEFNIQAIIKEMGLSRTTLFQKLKGITGQTPMEFILNIRLKKAADMLRSRPDLSITEISDMTGFSSSKYFSRIFKETYHIRPMDYRKGQP